MAPNAAVMQAIEKLDYRVTVGDLATQAGLDVKLAERDLMTLAADVGANLQVAESGDIAYQFPKDFRAILRNKFLQLRVQETWQQIWKVLFYLIRVSFGIFLILSIVILLIASVVIIIILTTQSKDGDGDGDSKRSSRQSSSQDFSAFEIWQLTRFLGMCVDLMTNYSYRRPAHRKHRQEDDDDSDLNFLEAVFSFLFGDGDPNEGLEDKRWQTIGNVIRNNKGAVIAEQIVPYLDGVPQGFARQDEDYLLPVLVRFNGRPAVSPEGGLIYHFPELQVTAEKKKNKVKPYLKEKRWVFSAASGGQITGAIVLGLVNFGLAVFVGFFIWDGSIGEALDETGLGFLLWLYPLLLFYGVGFLAIPPMRYIWLQGRNRKIEARNARRKAEAEVLEEETPELRQKLQYARQFAAETVVDRKNLLYSTERDLIEQELDQDSE
jgi:hypothetical protein